VTRPILAVMDGSKALSRAVRDVFDQPVIQRCQQQVSEPHTIDCAAGPAVQAPLPRVVAQARWLGSCFALSKGQRRITAARLRSSHTRIPR
jgi:hypothetical protein